MAKACGQSTEWQDWTWFMMTSAVSFQDILLHSMLQNLWPVLFSGHSAALCGSESLTRSLFRTSCCTPRFRIFDPFSFQDILLHSSVQTCSLFRTFRCTPQFRIFDPFSFQDVLHSAVQNLWPILFSGHSAALRGSESLTCSLFRTFCCSPRFGIFDASKNLIAEIRGPCCPCQTVCCTADIDFPVSQRYKHVWDE